MSVQAELKALANQEVQAPFGFEVFEQRRAREVSRRRTALWGTALSVSMLALVGILALVTQPALDSDPVLAAIETQDFAAQPGHDRRMDSPALVDMGQFELTSELEDRIAMLDAELSAARVQRVPVDQLRRIEGTRDQMNESLQRVSYAHALLSL